MNRPAALAVVAVAGVAALAVGVRGGVGGGNSVEKQTFGQTINEVRLDTGSADVDIEAGDVQKVTVEKKFRKFWLVPKREKAIRVDGQALVLPSGCGWGCGVDYTVRVPRGTKVTGEGASGSVSLDGVESVDLKLASGDVEATNVAGPFTVRVASGRVEAEQLRGDVDIEARSGDISVSAVAGKARLRTNSGTIDVENARGAVDAKTSSGDIRVELAAVASVKAAASSGSVDLEVPAGTYRVTTRTGSGDAEVGVRTDPNASVTLDASTSSGDIGIRER